MQDIYSALLVAFLHAKLTLEKLSPSYIKLLIMTETLIKRDSLLDLLIVNERSKKWSGGYWSEAVMNDRRNSQHIAL